MNAPLYLVTGAGGGTGGVSRQVVEGLCGGGNRVRAMVHHDDARADPLRELGAEVVVGDLTEPQDVVDAMAGTDRMQYGDLEVLVNMSQMTVSQMTLTSVGESHQRRLHYLAEHVLNWSAYQSCTLDRRHS
jgi:NAD(P)-dependent dehydrogenase (short-subunit alcohol dehydrogenase family)